MAATGPNRSNYGFDDLGAEAFVSRILFFPELPPNATEEQIRNLATPYGQIKRLDFYPTKNAALLEFYDIRDAEFARNKLKTELICGRPLKVHYSRSDRTGSECNTGTLYVRPVTSERNFIDVNTLDQYKELFNTFGEVKKVNCNRKREAEKFVEYFDLRASEEALDQLNGYNFNGVVLEVQFANQSSKTLNRDALAGGPRGDFTSGPPRDEFGSFGDRRPARGGRGGYGAPRPFVQNRRGGGGRWDSEGRSREDYSSSNTYGASAGSGGASGGSYEPFRYSRDNRSNSRGGGYQNGRSSPYDSHNTQRPWQGRSGYHHNSNAPRSVWNKEQEGSFFETTATSAQQGSGPGSDSPRKDQQPNQFSRDIQPSQHENYTTPPTTSSYRTNANTSTLSNTQNENQNTSGSIFTAAPFEDFFGTAPRPSGPPPPAADINSHPQKQFVWTTAGVSAPVTPQFSSPFSSAPPDGPPSSVPADPYAS